jgi:UDP-2,4-diacetamido-2,4,6-trideoxy-beta-L-altropyranose hydrolase
MSENAMTIIVLRKASDEDAEQIFSWRNDPKTREHFFDSKPVLWERHVQWLNETLQKEDKYLLIGEMNTQSIGVLRFDTLDEVAEISIYLDPSLHNKGLGSRLLEVGCHWVRDHLPSIIKIQAKVLNENQKSIKAFKKTGFVEFSCVLEYDIPK